MEQKTIITWIIALVALFILIVVAFLIKDELFVKPFEKIDCAASVRASAQVTALTSGEKAPPINCPTKNIPIPKGSDEEIKARVAKDMKECWDDWGRGELLLYSENGIYCHVCSYITFDEPSGVVKNFDDYLNNPIPGTTMTYLQYFYPVLTDDALQDMRLKVNGDYNLDKSKDYAVIFYYVRGPDAIKEFGKKANAIVGGLTIGATIGAVAGAIAGGVLCIASVGCAVGAIAVGAAAAVGGIGAYVADYLVKTPPDYLPMILLKEMNITNIDDLGCEYSFASR